MMLESAAGTLSFNEYFQKPFVDRMTAITMMIRDAMEADLPAIVAIYNASVPGRTATADTELVSVADRHNWFFDHDPEKRPLWVAVDDEVVVAWLSFQSFYGRPAYHATAEISLYVTPALQRKGIGRKLLARAVALPTSTLGRLQSIPIPRKDIFRWGFGPEPSGMGKKS